MGCQEEPLVQQVRELFEQISSLKSLKPSKDVNMLFTQLVLTCMPPSPIDVTKLCKRVQEMRSKLIRLCGEAEGLLESHFSTILGSYENPLDHLHIFPYYSNYLKLSLLEFTILTQQYCTQYHVPNKVAFVGSGPLPLTSIVLASNHLTTTTFHNYDIDPLANSMAVRLVSYDPDLSKRMFFHTNDIMNVTTALKDYEVVFLAALVGMDKEEKVRVIDHLAKYMAPGALLMLRSAHGARAFLYPVVDPCDLRGFEVLSVFHPTDEVINSVVIARKYPMPTHSLEQQSLGPMILPNCKCSEIQAFNPFNHGNMIEDFSIEERQLS
ncbi:nicotianamine synthase-like [Juglans microcarpa x Juglans regia]|uniref:nicotianamine synthase-like n=1 Tax=Juglans microcarpa x Juglans regia TaxID=2249226 RepID=UPI001B7DF044|nr:nicotianamine synthase-like [Juglans microcarpa x Juglans regia]